MNLIKYLIENTAHNIIYCSMFSGNPRFKKLLVNVYVFDELASVFLLKAANKSKDTFLFVVLQKPLASGKEDEIEKFIMQASISALDSECAALAKCFTV